MFKKSEVEDRRTESTTHRGEQSSLPKSSSRTPATIGPTIQIKGDVFVTGNQGVHIDGRVDGTITLSDNILSVGTEGQINATIDGRAIFVAGKVEGDLKGGEQVVIKSSGNVRGNIVAPRVTLEDGCRFKGSIDMDVESSAAHSSDHSSRNEKIAGISAVAGGSGDVSTGGGRGKAPGA